MKTKKYTVYADPGHSWVKVKFTELLDLNIHQNITPYSYTRNGHVYLEEDLDAGVLIDALSDKGIKPYWVVKHTNKQSKIRSYSHYIAPRVYIENSFKIQG
jgi:hypothetical protein